MVVILAATRNHAEAFTQVTLVTSIWGTTTTSPSSRRPRDNWVGRDRDEDITTKEWIILAATSNHAEAFTQVTVLTSI